MNSKQYWTGGYTLADLIKYCDNSGLAREEIKLVCSIYDTNPKNNVYRGCEMSEVQNYRLCITDKFLELMVRKDNLTGADNYFKTKVKIEDTGEMLKYAGRGADCYCTTQWEYFDEGLNLTKILNPEGIDQKEWYDKNGIKGDIFHITVGNKTYKNCTWANQRIVRVTR